MCPDAFSSVEFAMAAFHPAARIPDLAVVRPRWTHPQPTHSISLPTRVWEGTVSMAEQLVQRRLAAILAADVVDYSQLMGVDEKESENGHG